MAEITKTEGKCLKAFYTAANRIPVEYDHKYDDYSTDLLAWKTVRDCLIMA